mgnify:CR=1 FL=1
MIKIIDKAKCCGCSACLQRCPKSCIELKEDNEGFLYPHVNESKCIKCGLCIKVCPILNTQNTKKPQKVYAAINPNKNEGLKSSSGGIFIALAKYIINRKGVVFGTVWNKNWEAEITSATNLQELPPMMGSKYVQSHVGVSYQQVECLLKENRLVLYTGTPCQIAGLKHFLKKDYDNLLTLDFICHGVPSPGIWRKYKKESIENLKNALSIEEIYFRDKMSGWKKYSFVVKGKSIPKIDQTAILLSDKHYKNPYMLGFLFNIYLRPSCYSCCCKQGRSGSDITVADFWGIDKVIPQFANSDGVSAVLINTDKGNHFFHFLNLNTIESTINDVSKFNNGYSETIAIPYCRKEFYNKIQQGLSVKQVVLELIHVPFHKRAVNKILRLLKIK